MARALPDVDELVAAGLGKEDLSVARRFVAERGA